MKQKILEKDITKVIRDFLNIKGIFHYKVWQGLGSLKGVSDIIGLLPSGIFFAIEVKASRGKLSINQENFLEGVKFNKGIAIVARSLDDVINNLKI